MDQRFNTFAEFYPYYLSEHRQPMTRRLHFAGSWLALICFGLAVATLNPWWLLAAVVAGYGPAWIGHYFFEHNRPATFRHPLYSFAADWAMFADILRRRIPL